MKEKLDAKLDAKLDKNKITQTRSKRPTISFRDSAVDKITKTNTEFGNRKLNIYKFDIFSHRFISKNSKDEFVVR